MPDITIPQCPTHKDAPTTGCPNCFLYMKSKGFVVQRNQFVKAEGDPPKVVVTPIAAQPAVAPKPTVEPPK